MLSFPRLFFTNSNPISRRADDHFLQMLQSSMWPQLARIKVTLANTQKLRVIKQKCFQVRNCVRIQTRNLLMDPATMAPLKKLMTSVRQERHCLTSSRKHWYCGGNRSIAVAADLVQQEKIIAVPTDTIYGFAGLAQSDSSVAKLYEIKKRDSSKPFAICLSHVKEIEKWAEVDDLPPGLLEQLLPGPRTIILKRKPMLNPNLNPYKDDIGIRVPDSLFIRCVIRALNQPLALTSANESNKLSTLYPKEFEELWPQVAGIFYPRSTIKESSIRRAGSTIVDLTTKGEYKVIRVGRAIRSTCKILYDFGIKQNEEEVAERMTARKAEVSA